MPLVVLCVEATGSLVFLRLTFFYFSRPRPSSALLLPMLPDCAAAEEGCDVTITDCADGGTAALNTASATPSAIVGGTAAVLSAAAVLLACMDV